ncbi:gene transfer agent family protein [Bartonella tamiae]|uniref:Uncharacterized protein n=1 Tax=Bartonella tamiae Th239 TaxID=1094558 RepID=J1K2H0_9HYPH|nr:gene transfer agent family protein [Bartonella tamiae]EJF91682.1 hypothetical protein ME5_00061 [Bartonella tamiae Th239]
MANRSGKTILNFGENRYVFKIGYGQIKDIQDSVDAGPFFILDSFLNGEYRIDYIREVIRYGLVGGGIHEIEALKIVECYVEDIDNYSLHNNALIASVILSSAIQGAPEEDKSIKRNARGDGSNEPPLSNGKIRFSSVYGAGAVIGFTPMQIDQMSIWEFNAAIEGYIAANSASDKSGTKLTAEEAEELAADILAIS